jgi:hypothetical protein
LPKTDIGLVPASIIKLESYSMIADKELAKKLDSVLREAMLALDQSAALVRKESPSEAAAYATGVGAVFMCVYSELLDPIYVDHPDIAPQSWTLNPELGGE